MRRYFFVLLYILLFLSYTKIALALQDTGTFGKDITDLKIIVGVFNEGDVGFFNKTLTENDVVFTWGAKPKLLSSIKGPKINISVMSLQDVQEALGRLKNIKLSSITYNPEHWRSSKTPPEELEDLVSAVKKARLLTEQKNTKLSFATDYVLLEKYGERIAPLVDIFTIQLQRYQGETLEKFREETLKKINIVRSGSKTVPIFLQLSLSPPKMEDNLQRGKPGRKISQPIKAEVVFKQIETIKDLCDGIVFLYTKETITELKRLIQMLRE